VSEYLHPLQLADYSSSFLHVIFFLWCCNDTVFGLRGRSQRKHEKEERERRRVEEKEDMSPATNNSLDIEATPIHPLQKSHSASSLRTTQPVHPLQKSSSTSSLNSARPLQKSRSAQSLNSSRRHGSNRPRISAPVLQHHVSFDVVNSTYSVYTPNSPTPQLVLKPTPSSREALSLSIFETPQSSSSIARPLSLESYAESQAFGSDIRASHISLEPIPDSHSIDFAMQPHPRYTYYRGASSPALHLPRMEVPANVAEAKKARHMSTGDLDSVDDNLTALPQKDHFFTRMSQLQRGTSSASGRRGSGLRNVTSLEDL
jgi:hypothetical protein